MSDRPRPAAYERTAGDDVVVQLRVRRANLPALEQGIQLGVDSLTGQPIIHRLVRQPDGVYGLEVETNPIVMLASPEAVDPERVDGEEVPRGTLGCTCGTPPFAPPEPSTDWTEPIPPISMQVIDEGMCRPVAEHGFKVIPELQDEERHDGS